MSKKTYLVVDGQWGSTGKGLIASYLAEQRKPDTIFFVGGPNSGHTSIAPHTGEKCIVKHLPNGVFVPNENLRRIVISASTMLDPEIFSKELEKYGNYFDPSMIRIDPHTGVVQEKHRNTEAELVKIGSTKKGGGAALADKVMRRKGAVAGDFALFAPFLIKGREERISIIEKANQIQVESSQGLELSLNHSFCYPYSTFHDITPEAILNGCGIPLRMLSQVISSIRTFPIRVGNEYDAKTGLEIGNSGPFYPDQEELDWKQISAISGQSVEERTTVTNKVRRVAEWSWEQYRTMLWRLSPCNIFLNFANYLEPNTDNFFDLSPESKRFISTVANVAEEYGSKLSWLGFGPSNEEVESVSNVYFSDFEGD